MNKSLYLINCRFSNAQRSEGSNGTERYFKHPFLQCWGLSFGESSCILLFIAYNALKGTKERKEGSEAKEHSKFNPLLFLPAAVMHQMGRLFGFLSLNYNLASSTQIISGCQLIFVCIFSRIFLKKSLPWFKWFGVLLVVLGIVVVGLGDLKQEKIQAENINAENPVLGDIFMVVAIVFSSGQLTYEEKYVKKHNIQPLHCLGMEGSFSLAILSLLLVVLYFIPVNVDMDQPGGQLADALDGFVQLGNNPVLLASFLGTTVALCMALFAGISLTRKLSAVHRIVIDSGRSVLIWAVSLAAKWQTFQLLQIIGFLIMSIGVLIFNDVLLGKVLFPDNFSPVHLNLDLESLHLIQLL